MVQTPVKKLTLEDFLKLPETKPASEYIDGEIIQKPMPKGKHSILQGELLTAINSILKPQRVGLAFPELRCVFGTRAIVPDIAIFTWSRIPLDATGEIADIFLSAPDWVIEILSPDQSQTKLISKISHAIIHGTQMAWLIDPSEKSVLVFSTTYSVRAFAEFDNQLPVPEFAQDLHLTVGELFSWLIV
ncbi:Uma2 family endonuclease [Synechococcus sp. PCC 6312]|uniref:Uma2 family endonuclease n=1 Tax=Synechococcus sp. (strain ATCC 27167 / PCC 6312) TaxID=195253 RepID=UPI00029F1D6D|nr:Uma2 family endonuclease [Synechococcus sp. PCC 6312]AFY59420.1 hypothetical protein Syn6312_0170 [Synechococcus sp. PCC 6312]